MRSVKPNDKKMAYATISYILNVLATLGSSTHVTKARVWGENEREKEKGKKRKRKEKERERERRVLEELTILDNLVPFCLPFLQFTVE
jgi:hypothetical protein